MIISFHSGQHGGICYDLQASYMCYCPDRHFRTQCSPRSGNSTVIHDIYCTIIHEDMYNSHYYEFVCVKDT